MNPKIQVLYNQLAADGYDVGDINSFSQKITQPDKAKILYNAISSSYDLGDFDEFYEKVKQESKETEEQIRNPLEGVSPYPVYPKEDKWIDPFGVTGTTPMDDSTKAAMLDESKRQQDRVDRTKATGDFNLDMIEAMREEQMHPSSDFDPVGVMKGEPQGVVKTAMDLQDEYLNSIQNIAEYRYDKGEDQEEYFDYMSRHKQVEEWEKDKERWKDRPFIQEFATVADYEQGETWYGKTGRAIQNVWQAFDAGSAGVFGGLSTLMHDWIEKPLYGWMYKNPNSRMLWGNIADYFNNIQAYQSSAAGKHNMLLPDGSIEQKNFTHYFKEGNYAGAIGDLILGVAESMPGSLMVIGSTMAGQHEVGLMIFSASATGGRLRELNELHPEMSEFERNFNALGYGAIEGFSELLGDVPIGKMLGKVWFKNGQKAFKYAYKGSVDAMIKNTTKEMSTNVGKVLLMSGVGEGMEGKVGGMGQYLLDSAMGLVEFNSYDFLNEGNTEAAYEFVSGFLMSSGGMAMKSRNIKAANRTAKQINNLSTEYQSKKAKLEKALEGSGFKFEGEKILGLSLENQIQILDGVLTDVDLTDFQKHAIIDYMQVGNDLNAAIVNIGMEKLDVLAAKLNATKETERRITETENLIYNIKLESEGENGYTWNLKSNEDTSDGRSILKRIDEDGREVIKIAENNDITVMSRENPSYALLQRFLEIDMREHVKGKFGVGYKVSLEAEGLTFDAIVTSFTDTGVGVQVESSNGKVHEFEVPYREAIDNLEAAPAKDQPQGSNSQEAKAEAAYKAKLQELRAQAQEFAQKNTNPDMGGIVYARVAGKDVRITKGNIVFNEDGTPNREKSSKEVSYENENKEIIPASIAIVEKKLEFTPTAEAADIAEQKLTAPIIAEYENSKIRPYNTGEKVTIDVAGSRVMGEIVETTETGYKFQDVTGVVIDIEPRQIINEDNLIGVDNGVEVDYYIDGELKRGLVEDFYQYRQQGQAIVDGNLINLSDIIGVVESVEEATKETSGLNAEELSEKINQIDTALQSGHLTAEQETELLNQRSVFEAELKELSEIDKTSDVLPENEGWSLSEDNEMLEETPEQIAERQKEEFYNSLPYKKNGEIDYKKLSAEQELQLAEYDEELDDNDVLTIAKDKSKALYDKIKALEKQVAGIENIKAKKRLQAEKKVYDDYIAQSEITQKQSAERQAKIAEAEEKRKANREAGTQKAITTPGFEGIVEKWQEAKKTEGHTDEIRLANGEVIPGRYMLVEQGTFTPSHDANKNFAPTEGFPTNEQGENVNDRDYANDKEAQQITLGMAQNFDSRGIGIVVDGESGISISGNGRSIAGQIAAQNGTDRAYNEYILKHGRNYGFTPEQVGEYNHPRIVFIPDSPIELTTENFKKFNADEKKSQSTTEKAKAQSKALNTVAVENIANFLDGVDNLSDVYNNSKRTAELLSLLYREGIIQNVDLAQYQNENGTMTGTGKDMFEALMLGSAFRSADIQQVVKFNEIQKAVLFKAIPKIIENKTLGEYDVTAYLSEAIEIVTKANEAGTSVALEARSIDMLEGAHSDQAINLAMALAIDDKRQTAKLRNIFEDYNNSVREEAQGAASMFGKRNPADVLTDVLKHHGFSETLTGVKEARGARQKNKNIKQDEVTRTKVEPATSEKRLDAGTAQEEGTPAREGVQAEKKTEIDTQVESQQPELNPSEAQKEAGNYKKAHITVSGFDITIENPKGSKRKGVDEKGKDGDQIDVFVGDNIESNKVFVVDQVNPNTGEFDESKVMLGFNTEEEARAAYLSNYEEDWQGLGAITEVDVDRFKKWLYDGAQQRKAFSEYKEFEGDVKEKTLPDNLKFLEGELPNIPNKKDIIEVGEDIRGEINVQPIKVKLKNESVEKTLSRIDTEDKTKGILGIHYDAENKVMFASDKGHSLLIIPNKNIKKSKVTDHEGKEIEKKLLPYKSIISFHTEIAKLNSLDNTIDKLQGIVKANRFISKPIRATITYQGKTIYLDAEIMLRLLSGMRDTGTKNVQIELPIQNIEKENQKGVLFRDGEKIGLVMPLIEASETLTSNVINLTENDFKGEDLGKIRAERIKEKIESLKSPNESELREESKKDVSDFSKHWYEKLKLKRETELKLYQDIFNDLTKEQKDLFDEPVQDAKKSIKPEKGVERIEDVGEKIGGARKDLHEQLSNINNEDIGRLPLSKVFPKPDYAKMAREGNISTDLALYLSYLYDNLPPKPRKAYRVHSWANMVQKVIDTTKTMLSSDTNRSLPDQMKTGELGAYMNAMKAAGFPETSPNIGKHRITEGKIGDYAVYKGKKVSEMSEAEKNKPVFTLTNEPYIIGSYSTFEDAADALRKKLLPTEKSDTKYTKTDIYQNTKTKEFFVGKKTSMGVIKIKGGFETVKEASSYLNNNKEEIQAIWDAMRETQSERRQTNRNRIGSDWREGKDVTADEYMQAFGFRGVEFGNWVNQAERQESINNAYDALMDLSHVLGINPKAISLNGELGFAFGARGKGNASAHYEPGKVVINLTKTKGAGSLAHEWWHALDNYFSRMRKSPLDYVSNKPYQRHTKEGKETHVRNEILDAFKSIVNAVTKNTELYKRAAELDKTRSSVYWSTKVEMTARAFEHYVIQKLQESGNTNDYLANYKETEEWIKESNKENPLESYPYPTAEESAVIGEAFQQLFDAVEQKEDSYALFQKGNILFTSISQDKFNEIITQLQKLGLARSVILDKAKMREYLEKHLGKEGALRAMARFDRRGNMIGDGSWHVEPSVFDFSKKYPQVTSDISRSNTTESTYVTYTNSENGRSITVRFSHHENNAVKFGDQLDGFMANENEILFHLGLKEREFVAETYLSVPVVQIKRKEVSNYEQADITIQELYALGKDADVSQYKGKVLKGGNWLVTGDTIKETEKTRQNALGQSVRVGKYEYKDLRFLSTSDGEVYGFVTPEGDVYIDPDNLNANTPIHEFGHLWWSVAPKETKTKLIGLFKQTAKWKELENNPAYSNLNTDEKKADELFATWVGNRGENSVNELLNEANGDVTLFARIQNAINKFWEWLKSIFGNKTAKINQMADMTLEELFAGKDISGKKTDNQANNKTQTITLSDGIKRAVREVNAEVVNGFYSPIENAVHNLKQSKGTGEQMLAILKKEKGVKADELAWTGVEEWLKTQKSVTKEQILDYIKNNRVQILEVVKGGGKEMDWTEYTPEDYDGEHNMWVMDDRAYSIVETDEGFILYDNGVEIETLPTLEEAKRWAEGGEQQGTKYEDYQLKGEKSNYKEVLITMPFGKDGWEEFKNVAEGKVYKSPHWSEPNILVHLRMNERIDTDGNKVLFVEEVQSDWAQQGREWGFKQKTTPNINIIKEGESYIVQRDGQAIWEGVSEEKAEEFVKRERNKLSSIPSAPFVINTESWTKLGLKVALQKAVESGADKIAWTTGEQQNERYDLSKQVDELIWSPETTFLYGYKDGEQILKQAVAKEDLPNAVGKEVADRLIKTELKDRTHTLSGEQLQVGGSGMKGFYGSPTENSKGIIGSVAEKLIKEITGENARIETTTINGERQHSISITPEIRETIERGLPLFQQKYLPKKVTVKGVERPTRNSNGGLIHGTKEGIENFWKWFGDSKMVDDKGNPLVLYHGTPNASFNVFGEESYFTENIEYAKRYQSENASQVYKGTPTEKGVYETYLSIKKPFDTRNEAERKIFYDEFYRKMGNGSELSERGLPDWTDASDLLEFAKEKGYDGIVIDEGGEGGYGEEVKLRGASYVPISPNQIKSAVDNTGKFDSKSDDIRFQFDNSENNTNFADNEEARDNDTKTQLQQRSSNQTSTVNRPIKDRLGKRKKAVTSEVTSQIRSQEEGKYWTEYSDEELTDIIQSEVEGRIVEEYAKENGLWKTKEDVLSFGSELTPTGDEAVILVVDKDGEFIYKVMNLVENNRLISDYIDRIEAHNSEFPETAYEIIGFTRQPYIKTQRNTYGDDEYVSKTSVMPIVKQRYITDAQETTPEEINSVMQERGFAKVNGQWTNGKTTVRDLRGDNVLKTINDEGEIFYYIIDPIIRPIETKTTNNGIQYKNFTEGDYTQTLQDSAAEADNSVSRPDNLQREDSEGKHNVSYIVHQISENKGLKLFGDTKVKNAADVAHIFRALETASVENSFVVHIDKDGKAHIQFLSTGGRTTTIVDTKVIATGIDYFDSQKIYLVHNHPSGEVNPSREDLKLTEIVRSLGIPTEHVIIDTYNNTYAVIDTKGSFEEYKRDIEKGEGKRIKTYHFDHQKVIQKPTGKKLTDSGLVIEALQQLRFTAFPKVGMLVLDKNLRIVGNYIYNNVPSLLEVAKIIGRTATSRGVIMYGNQQPNLRELNNLKRELNNLTMSLFDYVQIDSNKSPGVVGYYESISDTGKLYESLEEYQTKFELRDPAGEKAEGGEKEQTAPKIKEGEDILDYAARVANWWREQEGNVSSTTKDINKANAEIKKLRHGRDEIMKKIDSIPSGGDSKAILARTKQTAKILEDYIRDNINKELADWMGIGELRSLLSRLHNPTSKKDIEVAMMAVDRTINNIETRKYAKILDAILKTKVLDKNKRGVSISKTLDDDTRKRFEYIRDNRKLSQQEITDRIQRIENESKEGVLSDEDIITISNLETIKLLSDIDIAQNKVGEIDYDIKQARENAKENAAELKKQNAESWRVSEIYKNKRDLEKGLQRERLTAQEELNDSYRTALTELNSLVNTGRGRLMEQRKSESERKREIIREAIRAVKLRPVKSQAEEKETTPGEKFREFLVDNKLKNLLLSPQGSFNYMLKHIDRTHPMGEGPMYNRFMKSEQGVFQAQDNYYHGVKQFREDIKNKVEEIFGLSLEDVLKDSQTDSGMTIKYNDFEDMMRKSENFGDEATPNEAKMTKGELLTVYMWWQQKEGKSKLEMMGIEENTIEQISDILGSQYISFAKWVQTEFLPEKRKKYNETHKNLFGVSMAKVENYFPIKYNKKDFGEKADLGDKNNGYFMPSTMTGSIINRVRNKHQLDMGSNAFELLMDNGMQMEEWNAYAPVRRDLNTILRNRYVKNLIDANDTKAYRAFKESSMIAVRSLNEKRDDSHFIADINRYFAGGAIGFRLNTALKQLLSFPAYFEYSNSPVYAARLARNLSPDVWVKNFKWALESLPGFDQRWESGNIGMEKINSEEGSNTTKLKEMLDKYMKIGMFPNRLVDAFTIVAGARSVYEHAKEKYSKSMSEQEAERMARMDAGIIYNETQQSARDEFLAPIQRKKDVWNRAVTTFMNANFSYMRKFSEGINELSRSAQPQIERMTKDFQESGETNESAKEKAKSKVYSAKAKAAKNVILYGFFMQMVWKLAQKYLYGLWDDDDEKEKDIIIAAATAPLSGLYMGSQISSGIEGYRMTNPLIMFSEGERRWNDISKVYKEEGLFSVGIGIEAMKAMLHSGGINYDTWLNLYTAAELAVKNGEWSSNNTFYLLNAPASQRKSYASKMREDETFEEYINRVKDAYDGELRTSEAKKVIQKKLYSEDGDMTRFNRVYKIAKEWDSLSKKKWNGTITEKEEERYNTLKENGANASLIYFYKDVEDKAKILNNSVKNGTISMVKEGYINQARRSGLDRLNQAEKSIKQLLSESDKK